MEWREDVGPARAGDAAARERLREYLTPFAHGVALASAPHHVADRLVPHILDEAMKSLGGIEDASVGVHVMNVARRIARESTRGVIEEQGSQNPSILEARQAITRLRALPEQPRERFLLRVVEGIPGPELAEVARIAPGELRAELERCAAEVARAFGQGQSFAGDEYLWELTGNPPALIARLEMQLPVLRFDPTAAPMPEHTSAGTFQELPAIGGAPMKPLMFEEFEGTETGVATEPIPAGKPAPAGPNPFEPQVRTIAATDLPAEARGSVPMVPWVDPSKSGRHQPLPPRPVPAVSSDPERSAKSNSGKSNSNKSGKQVQVGEMSSSSKSGRMAPMPPRSEVTKDAPKLPEPDFTEPKVPALIAAGQAAQITTNPESNILGKPTMMLPLSSAVGDAPPPLVANGATRVVPSINPATTVPTELPPGSFFESGFFKGGQPIGIAVLLAAVGFAIYSASLFAVDRQQRANWTLTQVVVAAEELGVGDVVTLENVALRAVPEPFHGSGVVRGDMMNFILDQKLAVGVQMGDPLFLSQFASMRKADERLSKRVLKRTRGYTIETNAVSAVGRWVKPGDLVDVIITIPGKTNSKGQVERRAVTLLQKVPVLATGKMADDAAEATLDERERQYGHVTMLLTAEEAEALTLGASVGKIKLTLRNGEDMEDDRNLDGAFTDSDTLLDGARQKVVRSKRQKIIQIIRNAKTGG